MRERDRRVEFISSYQGSATYRIRGAYDAHGLTEEVEVRWRAFTDNPFRADAFASDILPAVGTIKRYHCVGEWPSDLACSLFPEAVPARWNTETHQIEYRENRKPAIGTDEFGTFAVNLQ